MARWKPYYTLDLNEMAVLPRSWQAEVRGIVCDYGVDTVLTGSGSTSRERRANHRMVVRVADGSTVRTHLPWLWQLYRGRLREFCSASFGKPLFAAKLLRSAININRLAGRGAQYEWHVDTNPVTGLLFATDSSSGIGGSLVFREPLGSRCIVRPRAGTFICFDAREIEHHVAPLRTAGDRISVPMNYYDSPVDQPRPMDLDSQIYSGAEGV